MEDTNTAETLAQKPSRYESFVSHVIERCKKDKGLAARLRRADNPTTEYQSWEFLASMGVDLEWENKRLPYSTIVAAIARAKPKENGNISLGRGIALAYGSSMSGESGKDSPQAKARVRRLLACSEVAELSRILRPILSLVQSRSEVSLDYARLLSQMVRFSFHPDTVRAQWAQEFYSSALEKEIGAKA